MPKQKPDPEKNTDNTDDDSSTSERKEMSSRYVVYVDIDDELTAVFDKIKKTNITDIYLVVPKRALLFQSSVNLNILKKKAQEIKKTIALVTHDHNGIHLAQQAKIAVYKEIDEDEQADSPKKKKKPVEEGPMAIAPISATSNELDDETPQRRILKKISISEILQKRRSITERDDDSPIVKAPKLIRKKSTQNNDDLDFKPSRRTIMTLMVMSLLLLLAIGYVALPGATIIITPTSSVLTTSTNITFADAKKYPSLLTQNKTNAVATYPVAKTISFSGEYASTGKDFKGTNAEGTITIINTEEHSWPLIKGTRFQNPDGFVYRIQDAVTVPRATEAGNGTVEARVVADPEDSLGRIVGEKGNIGPSHFILPGLRESSQDKLYAENSAPFTGGTTNVSPHVTEQDIEAAREFVREELNKKMLGELLATVDNYNLEHNTKLTLLTGDRALVIGDPKISIQPNVLDTQLEKFSVSGEMPVKGIMYNHSDFMNILNAQLKESLSPDKRLVKVEPDSVEYRIIEDTDGLSQMKLTASVKGIEEYFINLDTDEGYQLTKKIKDRVVGISVDDAQNFVQNLPSVNKVEIQTWPFWSPRLPNMVDNIKVVISQSE